MEIKMMDQMAERVAEGETPDVSLLTLLGWFGTDRRGMNVVATIRRELQRRALETSPDFAEVWLGGNVRLERAGDRVASEPSTALSASHADAISVPAGTRNPPQIVPLADIDTIPRIGMLAAANRHVVSVAPGTAIEVATTQMMLHEFSQLPVLSGARECRGAVSWESIGKQTALGRPPVRVDDCTTPVHVVSAEMSLLDALDQASVEGFVLVKARDGRFQGLVTAEDLAEHFQRLTEPFILLGQIEKHLRQLIDGSIDLEVLRSAKDFGDVSRTVDGAADLTFGECLRLLENAEHWKQLGIPVDRVEFMKPSKMVRDIRNDVMHFSPDPVTADQLDTLRRFGRFLVLATGSH